MKHRTKDPERVRTGRLGGLTTAARGAHNTSAGRVAWERSLAAEFGITDDLDPTERQRRMSAALRLRMARLARARWGKKKGPTATETPVEPVEAGDAVTEPRPAA